jgi:hypothetical protein
MLLSQARDLVRDATTPGAVRSSTQVCGQVGPITHCESTQGSSWSVGLGEGPSVSLSHDANGRWNVGVGVEGSTPGFAGVTGSVTQSLRSGDVEICGGATGGLAPVMSGSVQQCWTVDRDRAREMREAIAYGQQMAAQRGQAAPGYDGRPLDQSRQDANQAYLQMLNVVRNDPNVYNNPFANGGGAAPSVAAPTYQQVPMPPVPNPPSGSAGNTAGISMDQFRASVNQSMQQFRQADAQLRQNQVSQPSYQGPATPRPERQLVFDDNAPRNANAAQTLPQYAPRNGYDAQGYRTDSPRNQYDAQGNRQDSPRNVYDAQGYRQGSPRNQYDARGSRADSTRPSSNPIQGNANGYSYDLNGPRSAVSGPSSRPSQAPSIPSISQRAYGTQSQTAALSFPGE